MIDGLVADDRTEMVPLCRHDVLLNTPAERRRVAASRSVRARARCRGQREPPDSHTSVYRSPHAHRRDPPDHESYAGLVAPRARRGHVLDVLVASDEPRQISEIIVVTGDNGAQRIAGGYGATVIDDSDQGHNVAAANGARHALKGGAERGADGPWRLSVAGPQELEVLIERPVGERSVRSSPTATAPAPTRSPPTPADASEPAFGEGSRQRHVDNAKAAGAVPEVVEVASLALDLDTPDDPPPGSATRSPPPTAAPPDARDAQPDEPESRLTEVVAVALEGIPRCGPATHRALIAAAPPPPGGGSARATWS